MVLGIAIVKWSDQKLKKKNVAANDNLETWGRRKTEAVPWKLSIHCEKIFIKKLSWILSTIKYHMIKDILKLFENLELFSCRFRIIEGKRRWRTIVKKVNTSVFCDRHFFVIATVFLWSVLVCDCHLFLWPPLHRHITHITVYERASQKNKPTSQSSREVITWFWSKAPPPL